MGKLRLTFTLKFRDDALRQHLAQFDTPLVERVNLPDNTLGEDTMLIEGNEFAEYFWREPIRKDYVRRPVTFKNPMRHKPVWCSFGLYLFRRLAEASASA